MPFLWHFGTHSQGLSQGFLSCSQSPCNHYWQVHVVNLWLGPQEGLNLPQGSTWPEYCIDLPHAKQSSLHASTLLTFDPLMFLWLLTLSGHRHSPISNTISDICYYNPALPHNSKTSNSLNSTSIQVPSDLALYLLDSIPTGPRLATSDLLPGNYWHLLSLCWTKLHGCTQDTAHSSTMISTIDRVLGSIFPAINHFECSWCHPSVETFCCWQSLCKSLGPHPGLSKSLFCW